MPVTKPPSESTPDVETPVPDGAGEGGPTLKVTAQTFPKDGIETRQFEDAFAFSDHSAAVADGASDAFEAGAWARLLVASYVHAAPTADGFAAWLRAPARAWDAALDWDALPWYAEQKARDVGGLATFLGLRLGDAADGEARFEALAVGDACLFHLRGDAMERRFPVGATEGFGTTPALLSTLQDHNRRLLDAGALQRYAGACRPGDRFLLATDALAEWLYAVADLDDPELGFPDWPGVVDVLRHDFVRLIRTLRGADALRNDDVTLLIVDVVAH